ncbi:MAG TPA: NAD(P)-dependent alcohol dehydrogenase [Gemmataceae bacterium]|jgi:NADPH:quinone reductase-like Zn-dependent oxidoreductase|nr:NAD(P)-dependent alcohol dehydrogenase [Gemmataceae bacterium]
MKVVEVRDKFGLDSLTVTEKPEPRPGSAQVLIKMRAWSLNYRDLLVVKGLYNPKLRFPFVPLSDGVGHIAAVGEGVSRVKVGDRVAGIFMQRWLCGDVNEAKARTALGGGGEGMLAEYVVLHEDGVVHVPEHLSDEEAATLPCAAVTSWHALISEGNVKAGDSVLVQGTGGVSIFALQFARLSGARVIATSSSDAKLERALRLGASDGINYKTTPDWEEKARELTGGSGVDHVVEVGGAGTFAKSLRAVRMNGRIYLIGILSGGGGQVNPTPILMKNARVQGIYVGSREMFEAMNRAIALHKLRPVVDRVFGFGEIRQALQHMESGAHFGKICLKV